MENKTTYHLHFTFLLIYITAEEHFCYCACMSTIKLHSCLPDKQSSNPQIKQIKVQAMNGRVYDPLTASFLSPDNYVQVPDYTPGVNRYAYALNNPLVYTDPDGNNPLIFGLFTLAWSANMAGLASMSAGGTYWQGFGTGITTGIMGAGLGYLGTNVLGITGAIPGTLWGIGSGGLIGGLTAEVAGGNFWSGAISGGIMGGLTGGISGYHRAQGMGLNPWTGGLTKETKYNLNLAGYSWREPVAQNDLGRFVKTAHSDLYKDAGKPGLYVNNDLSKHVLAQIDEPNLDKVMSMKSGYKTRIGFNPRVFSSARKLYLTSYHELIHAKQFYSGMVYEAVKCYANYYNIKPIEALNNFVHPKLEIWAYNYEIVLSKQLNTRIGTPRQRLNYYYQQYDYSIYKFGQ